jgi:sodium-dependent dicarboxylate transporter 2/3/5
LQDALEIDWGTILLFGGGLAIGELIYKTGLSEAVGNGFFERFGMQSLWGITALAIALAIITSELSSNTASAAMVIPIVIAIANSAGIHPIPPILGATMGASYGFMLPISTPPNAIVYGSGMIPIRKMMATGIFFDIIGFFVILLGILALSAILGWG